MSNLYSFINLFQFVEFRKRNSRTFEDFQRCVGTLFIKKYHTCLRLLAIRRPINESEDVFRWSSTNPSKSSSMPISSVSTCSVRRLAMMLSQQYSSSGMPPLTANGTSQIGTASGRLDSGTVKSRCSSGLQHTASMST